MSTDPGLIVPSANEIEHSWFKWKHWHQATAEDPRACWAAGMKRSYELALEQLIGLDPTLRQHHEVMLRVQNERIADRGGSTTYQNTEYRRGYHAAIADSAVFAGLVQTEQLLLSMLTEWRVEQDLARTVEEIETKMKVLIACEFSGRVRDAFLARGHNAWSCDLLPTEVRGPHFQEDIFDVLNDSWSTWDLMVAHPPCTYLARAGARWWSRLEAGVQQAALDFVCALLNAPIPRIALENPPGAIGTRIRPADQYVQPWWFGHSQMKTTGLWLKNLPLLQPTDIVDRGRVHVTRGGKNIPEWYNLPPSPDRWKERSRTLPGLAAAMAEQWT